jgi:hypothetical protein
MRGATCAPSLCVRDAGERMDDFIQWTNDCARELRDMRDEPEDGEAGEGWRQPTPAPVSLDWAYQRGYQNGFVQGQRSVMCPECGQCVQDAGVVVRNNSGEDAEEWGSAAWQERVRSWSGDARGAMALMMGEAWVRRVEERAEQAGEAETGESEE